MFYRISEKALVSTNGIRYVEFHDSGRGGPANQRYSVKIEYTDEHIDHHYFYVKTEEEARKTFDDFCEHLEKKGE